MTRIFKIATLASVMALATSSAFAADLDVVPSPAQTHVEFGSGWYLRGDISYTFEADSDTSFYSSDRFAYDAQSTDITNGWSFGVGHTFNDMFRADVTVDYNDTGEWSGRTTGTNCGVGLTGDCYSQETAQFEIINTSLNGYVSLGNHSGFKPYVGAGIGLANVEWSNYLSTPTCVLDPGETCALGVHTGSAVAETYTGATTSYVTNEAWALSYSASVGFEYRLDKNWIFDMGYRYTHIDGDAILTVADNPTLNGDSEFDNIGLHEVRAGLRYELW